MGHARSVAPTAPGSCDGRALPRELAAYELPCLASHRPGLDLPRRVVVVVGHRPILQVLRQRHPVPQRVVDRPCLGAAIGGEPSLRKR